ncbi:MAG: nucleotidyltransferase family protein [Ruminococcus sp.]|nr:nucleotidyltransferase family protein [Ruminococcus sp.]
MERKDYKQNAYYLIYLIRCMLRNRKPSAERVARIDLRQLFYVAKAHSLTAAAAFALDHAGVSDDEFTQAKAQAMRQTIIHDHERGCVLEKLEENGIWYMPLKGVIMKDYYPQFGMRQMCDNDILFDKSRTADVASVMQELGFKMEYDDSGHDMCFVKRPDCLFEMHTALFGTNFTSNFNDYYDKIKAKLIRDEDKEFGYHFTDEDFYIFMIAHSYKHFCYGGIGLRALLDTCIFLEKFKASLDWQYIYKTCDELKIRNYEKTNRALAEAAFGSGVMNSGQKEMLDYYIFSGSFGNTENKVKNAVGRGGHGLGAKLGYAFDRFAVPMRKSNGNYALYAAHFPFFYEHRILLPMLPFYRLGRSLIKSRSSVLSEIRTLFKA